MANPNTSSPIVVVGAGPTGLMLACELARRGVAVRVLEARTERERLSKALGVHARTLEVFADLGIADEAIARGRTIDAVNLHSEGAPVVRVTLDRLQTRFPYVLILPQWETEALLEAHLNTLGVAVERGVHVSDVRQSEAGVEVDVEIGGDIACIGAPYVIGCDGAHSVVREALEIPFDGNAYPETFALADMDLRWDRSYDEVHAFLSGSGICAVFPLPGEGRVRVAADISGLDEPELSGAFFAGLVGSRGGGPCDPGDADWTSTFRIHRRIAERFRDGRCFLAGDAAHIHSPAGGQGMNTGIQDAYNLGWKLAAVQLGMAGDALLDTYEEERQPVARATLRGTDFATRLGMLNRPLARRVRGTVAGFLSSFDAVQERITRTVAELDVHYRRSSAVLDDTSAMPLGGQLVDRFLFARGPHAGDRAPDVPLGDGDDRLHDAFAGVRATLLVFVSTPEGAADAALLAHAVNGATDGNTVPVLVLAEAPPAGLRWPGRIVTDTTGAAFKAYGATDGCAYLVRPDGYIGYRSDRPDARNVMAFIERFAA